MDARTPVNQLRKLGTKEATPVDRFVGRRVREARLTVGLTQELLGLAMRPRVTFQQIQKYEKGTNRISPSRLYAIARLVKRDMAWFFPAGEDDAIAPVDGFAKLATMPDGHRLVAAYLAIKNIKLRARIVEMAEAC